MAHDEFTSKWRNFAAWSAEGAVLYVVTVWGVSALTGRNIMDAALQSPWRGAMLGLTLLASMAMLGFTSWKRPVTLRNLRNFLIRDVAAIIACLLLVWGFTVLGGFGALDQMSASEWIAMAAGSALVAFASLGALAVASAGARIGLLDEEAADDLRERSRLILCSLAWTAACGLLLIALSLAGPGGVLPPLVSLAGALALIAVMVALGVATWRLSDELARTLTSEAGHVAFYLIVILGGAWAMLAHLGIAAAPAPLDWLTLFTVLMFAGSILAVARRKLLTR